MSERNTYRVTVMEEEGGPEPALRERLATVAAFRLGRLDEKQGHYPVVDGWFDMLDGFEGKFLWEMTDEELEASPPSRIDFEVVAVDPPERPAVPSEIRVTVRVPF
jgi:hypothetical protein